jgi:hypothetical protein
MAKQRQILTVSDFSLGINSKDTPDNLKDGECEDILNGSVTAGGDLEKRRGYRTYAGMVPLRAYQAVGNGTTIVFTLGGDSAFTGTTSGTTYLFPVVIQGKLSSTSATGDFTSSDQVHYYASATLLNKTLTVTATACNVRKNRKIVR